MLARKSLSTMARLKIFEANAGRCHICERLIRAGELWDVSHDRPLALGGADHGENLKVAHRTCHRTLTATEDVPRIAKARRQAAKHIGIKARSSFPCSRDSKYKRKMNGEVVLR
jgi:5-methylcytosine-specific restriction endonuclease McrA